MIGVRELIYPKLSGYTRQNKNNEITPAIQTLTVEIRYNDKSASSETSDLFSDERYLHALSKASSELSKPSVIIFLSSGILEAPIVSRFVTFSTKGKEISR